MGVFSDLMMDSQEEDWHEKKRKTKQEMIDFIFIYDQSISKEEMNTWKLEQIKNKYSELKNKREKRLKEEYKTNQKLTRTRTRRAYYD